MGMSLSSSAGSVRNAQADILAADDSMRGGDSDGSFASEAAPVKGKGKAAAAGKGKASAPAKGKAKQPLVSSLPCHYMRRGTELT